MLNKDVFVYKCMQKGLTEKRAQELYAETKKNYEINSTDKIQERCKKCGEVKERCICDDKKEQAIKDMKKAGFDVGFHDAMRLIKMLETD